MTEACTTDHGDIEAELETVQEEIGAMRQHTDTLMAAHEQIHERMDVRLTGQAYRDLVALEYRVGLAEGEIVALKSQRRGWRIWRR